MSRSGYSDCSEGLELWRANVERTIKGKRGQAFLRELAQQMDAMPVKRLIAGDLVTPEGECCTIGVVYKARGLSCKSVDIEDPEAVAAPVGISSMLAQEIEYMNDEYGQWYNPETPEERWNRMRTWVENNIRQDG